MMLLPSDHPITNKEVSSNVARDVCGVGDQKSPNNSAKSLKLKLAPNHSIPIGQPSDNVSSQNSRNTPISAESTDICRNEKLTKIQNDDKNKINFTAVPNTKLTTNSIANSYPLYNNKETCSTLEHIPTITQFKTTTAATNVYNVDLTTHLDVLQESLKDGYTVHVAKEGRLYYCNHLAHTAGWLPPCENWGPNEELPYGWEKAIDIKGRSYFVNHLNKTSTYEAPDCSRWNEESPPEPRTVVLFRSSSMGFGFVAGSEKPVIVRFVTEGGPSVNKLQPGDQILAVNDEDVKEAQRDHVIQLVRACESQVKLLVCQPKRTVGGPGRKSTLLSVGKRAKLRTRPNRVRFAESVCVNGAPLFPPSAFSLGDLCAPPMANVLKVFLENGQTKSFKYDSTTTVNDVVTSLREKLCLTASEHFSLVLEHVKSLKRNKLTLLDLEETLARIAARPGAHKLRCLFRVTFVPVAAAELAQRDLNALDYLYMQCCNDVTQERFAPELQPEVALRLAALHIHQHALANNISPTKLNVKVVEREFGLERFVPSSLVEGMKRKELRRLISHFLKLNSQMTGSSSKTLTQLQAKIYYLDIISGLPSYGAKCFSTSQREGMERVLLISPRFGLSQITGVRNSVPQPICSITDLMRVTVHREDDITFTVHVHLLDDRSIEFTMEERDAREFSLVLAGYFKLLTGGKDLHVDRDHEILEDDNAPPYLSQHTVFAAKWSYIIPIQGKVHNVSFLVPPTYHPLQETSAPSLSTKKENLVQYINCHDRNMNTAKISNNNHEPVTLKSNKLNVGSRFGNTEVCDVMETNPFNISVVENRMLISDDFGLDLHSVMAMELLEDAGKDCTSINGGSSSASSSTNSYSLCSKSNNGYVEAKNEEVLKRVQEMQKMVESSEQYLNEHGELIHEYEIKNSSSRQPWNNTSLEIDSDCESINSSKVSSNEDAPAPGILKHSDSLILLAEAINQDLTGITKSLNSINGLTKDVNVDYEPENYTNGVNKLNKEIMQTCYKPESPKGTPKSARKINGLSQLLSELQSLGNDFSQSESDSESVNTPCQSPTIIKRNLIYSSFDIQQSAGHKLNKVRTSFGLHSPDSSILESKDNNLKEYLKQLKELSKNEMKNIDHTDLAAKKLSELYGFDITEESFIETDTDLIDLRAIPPPQTPDELDSVFTILDNAPKGFGDSGNKSEDEGDIDKFLAKVTVASPTQKATPAKELTPEEIMSFIIPPPPNIEEVDRSSNSQPNFASDNSEYHTKNSNLVSEKNINNSFYNNYSQNKYSKESLYSNSNNINNINQTFNNQTNIIALRENKNAHHVIEYSTVERKGAFSCCQKSKKEEELSPNSSVISSKVFNCANNSENIEENNHHSNENTENKVTLPPKNSPNKQKIIAPARPPKTANLHSKIISSKNREKLNTGITKSELSIPNRSHNRIDGSMLSASTPLRESLGMSSPEIAPKRPPLPPISARSFLKNPQPLPKPNFSSPSKQNRIESPPIMQNLNINEDVINSYGAISTTVNPFRTSPLLFMNSNGHYRSKSDCPPVSLKNPAPDNRPQLTSICSPQMSRKMQLNEKIDFKSTNGAENYKISSASDCPPINGEALLVKTDIAMAGLLVKLDHVAAKCTAAQSAGGGSSIDDQKFEKAREELTEQTLNLVTASKLLVVAMSDPGLASLPQHLTSCLTAIRRITELTEDITRHTSSPLQTRNIVLKVHDVASSFRELAGVRIGLLGAGQLALQAECLAGVLTTLLRSLRVFSP